MQNRGRLGCLSKVFRADRSKAGIPLSKCLLQLSVEDPGAHLQEQMGSLGAPLHLLPLCEALGNDVVHRGFDEVCTDSLSLTIALAIVRDERLIVGNVRVELFDGS